jgi:hypothetical protein
VADGETGRLFEPGSAVELATLEQASDESDQLAPMGAAGPRTLAHDVLEGCDDVANAASLTMS